MIKNKGITLLELLIAISLLTLVLFFGSGIYLSGWNMFRNAQFIAQAQRNATVPMMHMVKNLQRAIRFFQIGSELQFTEYTNIVTQATATRRYIFTNNTIQYDTDTINGGEITIGTHINPFTFTISHDTPTNGVIVDVTITATDNNGNNPYTIRSNVEARCGATLPV